MTSLDESKDAILQLKLGGTLAKAREILEDDYQETPSIFLYCTLLGNSMISPVESQKGVDAVQRCSVENQKGAITVQSLWH